MKHNKLLLLHIGLMTVASTYIGYQLIKETASNLEIFIASTLILSQLLGI